MTRCASCGSSAVAWRDVSSGLRACAVCAEAFRDDRLFAPWGPTERSSAVWEVYAAAQNMLGRCRTARSEPEIAWRVGRVPCRCRACEADILPGDRKLTLRAGSGSVWYTAPLCVECGEELEGWGGFTVTGARAPAEACPF